MIAGGDGDGQQVLVVVASVVDQKVAGELERGQRGRGGTGRGAGGVEREQGESFSRHDGNAFFHHAILLPHAHSFVLGTAVINNNKATLKGGGGRFIQNKAMNEVDARRGR